METERCPTPLQSATSIDVWLWPLKAGRIARSTSTSGSATSAEAPAPADPAVDEARALVAGATALGATGLVIAQSARVLERSNAAARRST
jgi:hypothetical protein